MFFMEPFPSNSYLDEYFCVLGRTVYMMAHLEKTLSYLLERILKNMTLARNLTAGLHIDITISNLEAAFYSTKKKHSKRMDDIFEFLLSRCRTMNTQRNNNIHALWYFNAQ